MPKTLHVIVACSENHVIGRGGRLPWKIPEDFAFLQAKTAGQIVILGRICFQSWPGAVSQGRRPIVVSHDPSIAPNGVSVVSTFPKALAQAENLPGEIYVCGGQRIYEEALALAGAADGPVRLHLTLVHAEIAGDRYFPEWRQLAWR